MIVVTGGAGFIGSHIVRRLNAAGERDILVVDDLSDGRKIFNLADCEVVDYLDRDEFLAALRAGRAPAPGIRAVLHQGACTVTTDWDGRAMMATNFAFSKAVLHYCLDARLPLIYASSASVYGTGRESRVEPGCERPVNVYAWSKLVFDNYVRRFAAEPSSQVVGLRYFNVYGPGEAHKGAMASVILHFHRQLAEGEELRLFEGSDGFADGEQRRDFIHVDDVASVNLWFLERPALSGIYNLGTGRSRSFNDVARAVIAWFGRGRIRYVAFPEHLRGSYQSFTEADLSGLRAAGYEAPFIDVEAGVRRYLDALAGPAA